MQDTGARRLFEQESSTSCQLSLDAPTTDTYDTTCDDSPRAQMEKIMNSNEVIRVISARVQLLIVRLLQKEQHIACSETIEYMRFIKLKAEYDIHGKPSLLTAPAKLAAIWRVHVQDTKSYKMLETALGTEIVHTPLEDEMLSYAGSHEHTLNLYRNMFLCDPPAYIWMKQ